MADNLASYSAFLSHIDATARLRHVFSGVFARVRVRMCIFVLSVFCLPVSAGVSYAENITYTGNGAELNTGSIGGSGTAPGSVFSTTNPSGNTITVNYTPGGANTNPYRVFGGLNDIAAVIGNTVNFLNGTVTSNLYGGYDAAAASGFGAANNRVTISGGTILGGLISGMSLTAGSINNHVEMTGGTVTTVLYGGNSNGNGLVSGNTVSISGGNVDGTVAAGVSYSGTVTGNKATVSGGTVKDSVFGGSIATGTGHAENNEVVISGNTTKVGGIVSGRTAGSGNAVGNTVSVVDAKVVTGGVPGSDGNVAGGIVALSGEAKGNRVTISGNAEIQGFVEGGWAGTGTVIDNVVTINGGSVAKNVFGGNGRGSGEASGNSVVITGGQVGDGTGDVANGWVLGGASASGRASGNSVTLSNGTVNHIDSGESTSGEAANNSVTITGGEVKGNVRGGWSNTGNVTGNSVVITGGIVSSTASTSISGGYTNNGKASGNSVFISGGSIPVSNPIYGGFSGGIAENNRVVISGGEFEQSTVRGGRSSGGDATGNTVTISGGTGTGFSMVTGGQTDGTGDASGNTVVISGGKYIAGGSIVGGFSSNTTGLGYGNTINNTVTLSGSPDLSGVNIYGGLSGGGKNVFTGNTLEIRSLGLTAFNAANFQHFRFYLPSTVKAGDVALTLTDPAGADIRTPAGNSALTTVGVGIMGGGTLLKANDTVTLIKAEGGFQADADMPNSSADMAGVSAKWMAGISTVYTLNLETTPNSLMARVTQVEQSDPAIRKSPAEGKAASVTLVTQGGDLAAGQGIFNARQAAGLGRGGSGSGNLGVAGFGAMSGGTSRYNTGSHVDVNSFSLMTGLAKKWEASGVDFLGGVFFEAGFGSYNSYNSLEGGGSVKGKGDSRYFGGGLLGRMDVTQGALRGLYGEASFRVGGLHSTYKSSDLNPALGQADYSTNATYYGAHAGLGYVWELSDKANLDLYGKYFWTHTTGSNVRILGDDVRFKDVDSHRTRLGGRFSYAVNEYITPYLGLAWDYEFDGKARSVVAGVDAPAPSLKGSTGVGELGLTWKPKADSPLSVDFGVQGYVGMREGVSGNVQLRWEF